MTDDVADFFSCFLFFCDLTWLDLTWLDLDSREQGWYLYRTTTGDQNKRTSEEYLKYQNYLYLLVTTIPVKVIVITRQNSEVFYKHHIYVFFFVYWHIFTTRNPIP